ncbi:hypothetical protein BKA81DRAFT_368586 [Phyllosticta paracitricarpa]
MHLPGILLTSQHLYNHFDPASMAWRLHSAFAPSSFQNLSSMPWCDDTRVWLWLGTRCFRSALASTSCVMCIPPVPTRARQVESSKLRSIRGTWRIVRHHARHAAHAIWILVLHLSPTPVSAPLTSDALFLLRLNLAKSALHHVRHPALALHNLTLHFHPQTHPHAWFSKK